MTIKNTVSLAALLALSIVAVLAIGGQGVVWLPPRDQHEATLVVADANGLTSGSKLLLRGVGIGRVTDVRAAADRVEVDFRYHGDRRIPLDSAFRVENLSTLGETYLAVLPHTETGPFLADHQRIAAGPATVPTTFGELSVALIRLLNDLPPAQITALTDELSAALPAEPTSPANLARAGSLLATTLLMSSGTIRALLTDAQSLLERSGHTGPAIAAGTDSVRAAGVNFAAMAQTAIEMMHTNDYPNVVHVGPLAVFAGLQQFEDKAGADVHTLTAPLLPSIQAGAAAMGALDISRLLDTAMAAVATPGAVTVHPIGPR
ncbi:MlaD family protein [Nocardia pseudobrasiliensis]|uniref:Phospholipid/cholesterol/gamma-HCH transport system substrate-binding protein n=1 Tax=Nocardia pseudobrasiliensis TaxID=45979 RepID=A0A370ICD2_9NOCA|nr:MlaD family protein [Nocardia pseudobrasiliensis]RDI68376.1 phospholipid/cholesterol/gamma-HCH transport system substrate-binding protein [Nocardia pseudobrasiliensis]